ncbi:MAG: ISKra4 family transposase [Deltaproteobacteria bacterium]
MDTIDQARREVQTAFAKALATADTAEPQALAVVETSLWTQVLALGAALITLYLVRQASRPRPARYEHDGKDYELDGTASRKVGTRFGKVVFQTPVGRRVGWPLLVRDLPLNRELGLCSGFSLVVVLTLAKLCAQMAFGAARRTFKDVFEWSPSQRATLRMVDGVGAQARPFLEQAAPPDDDGEVMMILADGKGAPTISSREYRRRAQPHQHPKSGTARKQRRARRREEPRPRRTTGKKSKNAKMAAVGAIYTLKRVGDELEGPVNKRLYATFESYRALFEWLLREAKKRGYGTAKIVKVLFIADGAETLWDLQAEYFPDADMCVDWYHVVEKLWTAGKTLHRKNRKALETWVAKQKKRLRSGHLKAILAELRTILDATPRTGPGNKYRRSVLEKTLNHFTKNAARMQYRRLRSEGMDIGSGVIEGAVRHLVGVRLDGPGMRWSRDRAEAVLHLRCILINGQWDDFARHLTAVPRVVLPAQPVPTRTHDAKVKKAANDVRPKKVASNANVRKAAADFRKAA